MLEFVWPWMFFLLPLPLLARWLLRPADTRQAALRTPFLEDFRQTTTGARPARDRRTLAVAGLCWLLLIVAVARPEWVGDPVELPVSGRDLMMAVDLSGSMQEQDFVINNHPVDRLTAAKKVAGEFIERRAGDRLGLILFGDQAYVQTPLTFDHKTVNTLLQEAVLGLAGERTAIGDAIGLAVKRLQHADENSRVLILLTDGANTAGEVQPLKAADLAAKIGLKIYTIGIGADEILRRSFFGVQRINPSRDLDEKTLTAIAEKTGGRYFRARNTEELQQIYGLLDQLEPAEQEKQSFRPTQSLFHWPLALSLSLMALLFAYKLWHRQW